jgi:ABC-type Fe3+/spermidine/putrescine transport system ATPase subunit
VTAALRTQRLAKRYAKTWALRDCTLSLPQGRVVALVGPNGAGKTTLLQLAVGLAKPTWGTVEVFGAPVDRAGVARVGFVAQEHPLYCGFAVADPHLPRSLASQLRAAGFGVDQPQVLVLLNSDYSPDTYSVANGEILADFAVTRGKLTREEANAWLADLHQLGSQGRYFFSLNRYLFLATR